MFIFNTNITKIEHQLLHILIFMFIFYVMLTQNEFTVLSFLESSGESVTQRKIATSLNKSLGTVNKIFSDLCAKGFLSPETYTITSAGYKALEPYRVKRAVIMAAGFSARLAPVTLNTPKPLVRIHGKRMIEYQLDALIKNDITEIYIVRGYLGEQFDQLRASYPTIQFIENPLYNESNNISSMYFARAYLQNAYVCEADVIPYNKFLISKYQYNSNYLAIPVEKSDDWCFYEKNGFISRMTIGGEHCFQMVGISYWDKNDGKQLASDIKEIFERPGGKERYWDQVALEYHLKDYKVAIRECTTLDVTEIDTFSELKKIDQTYRC